MAQKVTVKEVHPATAEKKPTVLVMAGGARMSGFQAGLKDIRPGAVLEVEVEVQGQYINIKEFKEISPGGTPGVDHAYQTDPAQKACELVMSSYVQLLIAGVDAPPRLKELWDRSIDWCDAKIPKQIKPQLTADQEFDKLRRDEGKQKPVAKVAPKITPTIASLMKVMKDNGWDAVVLGKYLVDEAGIKITHLNDLTPEQMAETIEYIVENPK